MPLEAATKTNVSKRMFPGISGFTDGAYELQFAQVVAPKKSQEGSLRRKIATCFILWDIFVGTSNIAVVGLDIIFTCPMCRIAIRYPQSATFQALGSMDFGDLHLQLDGFEDSFKRKLK